MKIDKAVYGLNSKIRRNILVLLSKRDMTPIQIYRALGDKAPKYRQSINKALYILQKCGLVAKYVSSNDRKLYYKITVKDITINLENMEAKGR